MNRRTLALLGMAAAMAAGCADDVTEPPRGASVKVAQGLAVRAALGDTVRLSASVLDRQGRPVPGAAVRWTSADATVARVDASGRVVAAASGSTTVTATAASGASADVIVTIGPVRKVSDRTALTALYEATDGPNWTQKEGWLTDAPLEDWYGVDADASGRVVALALRRNGLAGELPPELGDLERLEALVVASNRLAGEFPPEVTGLANLRDMRWGGNAGLCAPGTRQFIDFAAALDRVSGPFCHDADVAALEALHASAGGASWTSSEGWLRPGPLSDWHGVETDAVAGRVVALDLNENGLSGVLPGSLSSLKFLRELRIGGNGELGGRLPLGMTGLSLQTLRYDGTSVCAPADPAFRNWVQSIASHAGTGVECPPLTDRDVLEALYYAADGPHWNAADNWLTELPLADWHGVGTDDEGRVTYLSLPRNGLGGVIPAELGALASLEGLDLFANGLTGELPAELGALANLRVLFLGANGLTGELPAEWGALASLEQLELYSNSLTGAIPGELGALANLERLDLYSNGLTGAIPAELGALARLQHLDLLANELTGAIPGELGALARLRYLDLSANRLTGVIPAELGALASLEQLDLYANGLTGAIPGELSRLGSLKSLSLSYNRLTGAIPAELGALANLESLSLSSNGLTGAIPAELGRLGYLESLSLRANDLTGPIPAELGNLASLSRLYLTDNAGMSGTLPAALASLDLSTLQLGGTGLCAPQDAAFQSWLRSIPRRRVSVCVERADGGAGAAAYVVQAVQSLEFPVPLVAGRPGLLRVFASAPQAGGARAPAARATFYQRDGSERTFEVPAGTQALTAEFQEDRLGASANVEVPADVLRPGVEMVVEVDPDGALDSGLGVPARIPAEGRTALEVHELPSFDVTVVPFLWEAEPDSSILDVTQALSPDDALFEDTRILLPVGAMTVTVHEPVWTASNSALDLLEETTAIRALENGRGYWMGTLPGATEAAGVAWISGRSMFSIPLSYVVAHEFGHNIYLFHAPCGGAGGPDPSFPDRQGRVGAWGWDRRSGTLVPPDRPDLMSYCRPEWIGDYHFAMSLRWRMHDEAGVAAFAGPPTRVLLLWGGADADGKPFLHPAFVVDDARASAPSGAGEWRIVGEAADGRALFDRRFEMGETADGDGRSLFVFTLPAEAGWADAMARIVLTGPGGTVELDAESGPAAALLRDPDTGRVRGLLRDWPGPGAQADAAALPEPGLEVQVSRGVPAPDAWRR